LKLSGKGISVNAVCPGWVRTEMGGKSASRLNEHRAETPVWQALEAPPESTGKFFRDKSEIKWLLNSGETGFIGQSFFLLKVQRGCHFK
jgi:NAD(P)-dependent dehydrogenase (short-subunit alcohol dehydrogenase family)